MEARTPPVRDSRASGVILSAHRSVRFVGGARFAALGGAPADREGVPDRPEGRIAPAPLAAGRSVRRRGHEGAGEGTREQDLVPGPPASFLPTFEGRRRPRLRGRRSRRRRECPLGFRRARSRATAAEAGLLAGRGTTAGRSHRRRPPDRRRSSPRHRHRGGWILR